MMKKPQYIRKENYGAKKEEFRLQESIKGLEDISYSRNTLQFTTSLILSVRSLLPVKPLVEQCEKSIGNFNIQNLLILKTIKADPSRWVEEAFVRAYDPCQILLCTPLMMQIVELEVKVKELKKLSGQWSGLSVLYLLYLSLNPKIHVNSNPNPNRGRLLEHPITIWTRMTILL
ncbi:hypothetical protein KSP39_PZI007265 [Platanthera zijinensis]|uniref:Uncharacterized protein n=1 Tax=Platanthera zijinensis TaxID=2320716 RepID=A0AAP0BR73_9ASPA